MSPSIVVLVALKALRRNAMRTALTTLGVIASSIVGGFMEWATVVTPEAVVVAFGVALAIGFFGFYPPRKSASLNPIDALRYE